MVKEKPEKSSPLSSSIDPRSGFCSKKLVYYSLRPSASLPPETAPLSFTSYFFSLLRHPTTTAAFIDATTHHHVLHSELQLRVKSLAFCLHHKARLSKGDCAFILAVNSPQIPVLFLSLFSLGVIVTTSNPANSVLEISDQVSLSKPVIAFTTSDAAHKLPSSLRQRTVLLDSAEFNSWPLMKQNKESTSVEFRSSEIYQSDTAPILYSSGTTGKFKGVELTHRNFISAVSGSNADLPVRQKPPVILCTVPFFHIYGFLLSIRDVAFGATVISTKKFDLRLMMRTVEESRVTRLALAPPAVVALVNNAHIVNEFDLSSLEVVLCAGAPLANSVIERFQRRFPNAVVAQAYGLTETTGGVTRTLPSESRRLGTVGRLVSDCQAKIVDPYGDSNNGLPPLKPGELWIRGPSVMKGYLADNEATDTILNPEGWLRTGDICYFDEEGFLFYVDRIKELIKYKAYQIAPAELEHLLLSHPDITNAAVIPYPDEEAGQVPVAFVVRKSGSAIDEPSIIEFAARQASTSILLQQITQG